MAADRELNAGDSLLRIEISPALPCGIGACGEPAYCARIERDPRYDALWRLLPICEFHIRSLEAAARAAAADVIPSGGPPVSSTAGE